MKRLKSFLIGCISALSIAVCAASVHGLVNENFKQNAPVLAIAEETTTETASDSAAEPELVETWDISATSADSVTAYLYTDPANEGYYTLSIEGIGAMKDFWRTYSLSESQAAPWYSLYRKSIDSVSIKEGITYIGSWAFQSCGSNLISIPSSVTIIAQGAFYGCNSLTQINIPEGVTSIGVQAFSECDGLTSVEFAEDSQLMDIGGNAFTGCESIVEIMMPDSVVRIGVGAFEYCPNLKNIQWSENSQLTNIGSGAFYRCDNLVRIELPKLLMTIEMRVFEACGLEEIIINEQVTSIGAAAFKSCSNLKNINLPESIINIDSSAFSSCSSLTSVEVAENSQLTSIGVDAFYNCSSLMSMEIPKGVVNIEGNAFRECKALNSITFLGSSQLISIGSYAFYNCSSLTSIKIPDGVTSIGNHAFDGCGSLTSINIPNGVTSIGEWVFWRCNSLTSIKIPDGVTSIGSYAFYSCNGLTSIKIPDSVKNIGKQAFRGCYSLTGSINIPEGVMSIEEATFSGCSSLTSIIIPESVTSIGNSAFANCSGLTSINIPDKVTTIGNSAFANCSGLTSINIPDSVTSIGNSVFSDCSSLTKIEIPDSVTSIGNYAFRNCSRLTSINIPNGVTSIGSYAFEDCKGLSTVYLNNASFAESATGFSDVGYLFSADSTYGARQAIAVIGENPTVGSYITTNYPYTEIIDYKGNTYTVYSTHEQAWEQTEHIDPLCEVSGFEQHECTTCGLIKNRAIAPIGHAWQWELSSTPTDKEIGGLAAVCGNDGAHENTHELPMLNVTDYTYEVITPQTCETTGVGRYTYVIDGQSFFFDVEIGKHTDENADEICDVCGEFVDEIGRVYGVSLSLTGNIGVNFYMELGATVVIDVTAYLEITLPSGDVLEIPVADATVKVDATTGKQYHMFSCEVSAKDASHNVAVRIVSEGKRGTEYNYSVESYADKVLESEDEEFAAAKPLVQAMMDYGKFADSYFNKAEDGEETTAPEETEEMQAVTQETVAEYAPVESGEMQAGIEYAGCSLVLKSETALRIYFRFSDGAEIVLPECFVKASGGEEAAVTPIKKSATVYYIEIANLSAERLSETFTIRIGGFSLDYSALSYVKTVLEQSEDAGLLKAVKSLYLYHQAAKKYFGV